MVLGAVGGAIGGGAGQALGAALGGMADRAVVGALTPARQRGPRLETLRIQSSAEGAPMACAFGRARVTGQVIWAARFLERRNESAGGKGGPKTVDHAYSLSFAVAVCEGPINGIGRVWADGRPLDLATVTMRVHRGTEDQTPDPLIEAVEQDAPAYRGTAYVVFEDLALGPFGDRPPQLSFEVFRRPEGGPEALEELVEGVCLIPGAGEFTLATEPVFRRVGLTRTISENVNNGEGRPDLLVSVDQLKAQCPYLKRVSLVVGWFGDDLRAAECRVRPGVERRDKATEPLEWGVAGMTREDAHLVSRVDGRPAYGGTPSDQTVKQAIAALKARGLEVTLYPFVFMDVPADNDLPDPYGGERQAAYPWRGRITGRNGADAVADVAAVFGGPSDWGLRRQALHYAALAAEAGADGLLIGSELRGLTWTRDADGDFPAVAELRALAAECRAIVGPEVRLSYAADWSEYFGYQPADGSGDVIFHLDPLWADPAIDHVAIDWYPPMGDWREEEGGIDAEAYPAASSRTYLAAQVAGAEGFDWFYASVEDRAAQVRSPIIDTAHGEDWVFRNKDLAGWWSHAHHDRPGGMREVEPTAWVPGMKPIRLTEVGCAAVDRGGNAPNLFLDPKSAESFLPPFSTGVRDDRMQRRMLEAVLRHYQDPENNPPSGLYDGRMLEGADVWCWDARPYPAFPARKDLWADVGAWRTGHWLNGRMNGDAGDLLAATLRRGGLTEDDYRIELTDAEAVGFVIDRPMRTRDAVEALLPALDLIPAEQDGRLVFLGAPVEALELGPDDRTIGDAGFDLDAERTLEPAPGQARVRYIAEGADYQTGSATARGPGEGGVVDIDLPVVCGPGTAEAVAERARESGGARERVTVGLGPLAALRIEAGDVVTLSEREGLWRVEQVALDERPRAVLRPEVRVLPREAPMEWRPTEPPMTPGAPFVVLLDLPPLASGEDGGVFAAAAAEPWSPVAVHAGPDAETLTERGRAARPATVGRLTTALAPGRPDRWDEVSQLVVTLEGGAPQSQSRLAVLGGANAVAVEVVGGWEVVQFRQAQLIGQGEWRLTGLLRGQQGTEDEAALGADTGARVVVLDGALASVRLSVEERGLPLIVRAGPEGLPPGGARFTEVGFTPRGVVDRPWSPARLTARWNGSDLELSWLPRPRRSGDVWDREPAEVDPRLFRLTLNLGDEVRIEKAVEGLAGGWSGDELASAFPNGLDSAEARVAQWGESFGWGVEARLSLTLA